jgi:transposase
MKKWDYILGIDVSRNTLDVYSIEAKEHIQIENNAQGFKVFMKWSKTFKIRLEKAIIALEYTGGYEHKLLQFLESKSISYIRIPGLAIKNSQGISRGKTDMIDAQRIARYVDEKQKTLESSNPLNHSIIELKEMMSLRKRLVRELAGYKASLKERLHMYPNKKNDAVTKIYKTRIAQNEKTLADMEDELNQFITAHPDIEQNYQLLTTIRGIGKVNALMTIAYTENFESFVDARKYAVYIGVAPFEHSSGTSVKGRKRVSHIANKELKQELNQAARTAIKWDPELREYAQKKLQNKCYGIILNNVKFKLVLRMFAVVKRKEKYVDNYQKSA